MSNNHDSPRAETAAAPTSAPIKCGLVMPISAIDGCSEQHWAEVKAILSDAVESVGFAAELVSVADDIGVIQKRIVQNLYENPIVAVDVSGKNPNVMFELGLRLAFDKPTIIVKDDVTTYSFDTSPIEHLGYPRDLRFAKIVAFKKALADKVRGTHEKAINDREYSTFLKHFGTFTVPKLETQEISKDDFIIEQIRELQVVVNRLVESSREHGTIARSILAEPYSAELDLTECYDRVWENYPADVQRAMRNERLSDKFIERFTDECRLIGFHMSDTAARRIGNRIHSDRRSRTFS